MLKTHISSDCRAPPSGLRVYPSEGSAGPESLVHLADRENFAISVTPTDLLKETICFVMLGSQLLRLAGKSLQA